MTDPNAGVKPAPRIPRVAVNPRARKDPQMLDLDQDTLKPGYHYRWIRCRADEHASSVLKAKLKGYTIVTKEEGVQTAVEPDSRPDKAIAIGDLILMKCPEELRQQRVRDRREFNERRLSSTSAVTKEMAKQKGVKVISDDDTDG